MAEEKDLEALLQTKIDEDADFQSSLELMSDEEKTQAITDKKAELIKGEFTSLSEKSAKADELAKNYKIRAEKAEQELKKAAKPPAGEEPPKKPSEQSLTSEEVLVLVGANITQKEDIAEAVAYARYKNIPLDEALKSNIVKNTLKENEEFRKTAQATNTAVSRKGVSKVSGEDLLDKFKQGDIPDKPEDIAKIIEQRWAPKEK